MKDERLAQAARGAQRHPAKPAPAAERLKTLRREAGLSLREMARELGLSPTSYQHYEDRFKRPYLPVDLATRVISVLARRGLTTDALADLVLSASEVHAPSALGQVPILTAAEIVGANGTALPPLFALRVADTAIDRIARPGSVILVDAHDREPVHGRYYVVAIPRAHALRRFTAAGSLVPWSTSPGHAVLTPGPRARIVGRIVRVVTDI